MLGIGAAGAALMPALGTPNCREFAARLADPSPAPLADATPRSRERQRSLRAISRTPWCLLRPRTITRSVCSQLPSDLPDAVADAWARSATLLCSVTVLDHVTPPTNFPTLAECTASSIFDGRARRPAGTRGETRDVRRWFAPRGSRRRGDCRVGDHREHACDRGITRTPWCLLCPRTIARSVCSQPTGRGAA
jgi:hypothetical protein